MNLNKNKKKEGEEIKSIVTSYHYKQYNTNKDEEFIEKPYLLSFEFPRKLTDKLTDNKGDLMLAIYSDSVDVIEFEAKNKSTFIMTWPFEDKSDNIDLLYKQKEKGKALLNYDVQMFLNGSLTEGKLKKNENVPEHKFFIRYKNSTESHENDFLTDKYSKKPKSQGEWCFTDVSGRLIVKAYNIFQSKRSI